jgi:ABC-type phosphate/phosphonate transport system substrate-binding protein
MDEHPDVLEQIDVIWRIPAIIPYNVMVLAYDLPPEISLAIGDALFRITGMQAGRLVLGQAYGIAEWERVTDAFYEEYRLYLDSSDIDLESLLD